MLFMEPVTKQCLFHQSYPWALLTHGISRVHLLHRQIKTGKPLCHRSQDTKTSAKKLPETSKSRCSLLMSLIWKVHILHKDCTKIANSSVSHITSGISIVPRYTSNVILNKTQIKKNLNCLIPLDHLFCIHVPNSTCE